MELRNDLRLLPDQLLNECVITDDLYQVHLIGFLVVTLMA